MSGNTNNVIIDFEIPDADSPFWDVNKEPSGKTPPKVEQKKIKAEEVYDPIPSAVDLKDTLSSHRH